ncbi:hypothetical protein EDB89DRAFT_1913438 [Lactarius sanguifluus]|nr:hypothetical protein EDB89DRAFT_1913438 [Lactarius sanguifluus]
MSIPVDLPSTPLQIVPSCSSSLSGPGLPHVNFPRPFSIPSISVSDLGKTLSTHVHELQSKCENLARSRSDAAKPRDAFAYWLKLEQYTPRSPSFVFDPGGLALALHPAHEDSFRRNPRTRGAFTITSSITITDPSRIHQVESFTLVICSAPVPPIFDNTVTTSPPCLSSPLTSNLIPVPLTSLDYALPHSSLSSLTDTPTSCPPSLPLVKELVFRYAPLLDPRLLHHNDLPRSHPHAHSHHSFLLSITPLVTSFSSPPLLSDPNPPHFDFVLTLTITMALYSAFSSISTTLFTLESAHIAACQRKLKADSLITTRSATIQATFAFLTPAVDNNSTIFSAEIPKKAARRSLTGDGQDFDPPGGVRLARALAPKLSIFGLFGLGPVSHGSATISVSRSHIAPHYRSPSIAFLPLASCVLIHTHTHTVTITWIVCEYSAGFALSGPVRALPVLS